MQTKYSSKAIKDLEKWLSDNNLTKSDLAKKLDCYWSALWFWFTGRRLPPLNIAVEIEKMTKGKVACASWIPSTLDKKVGNHSNKPKNSQQSQKTPSNHHKRASGKKLTK